ncbi:MAG: DNA-deoxyinosine glycosylase [Peptococcaceae bacterium]|nr:DNA-deoxyinosine glycosylase [Peptococcaceae bacterium]
MKISETQEPLPGTPNGDLSPEAASRITSFDPVVSAESQILILGSIPGEASLRAHEYYAHPRNAFWSILYAVWAEETCEPPPLVPAAQPSWPLGSPLPPYQERLSFLLSQGLALWDVIAACRRTGSLDSAVHSVEIQPFDTFFATYPNIRKILFNGRKAHDLFSRQHGLTGGKIYHLMPSTSPAHASLSFAQKLALWREALL